MAKYIKKKGFINMIRRAYAWIVWPIIAFKFNSRRMYLPEVHVWLEKHGYELAATGKEV